MLVYLKSQKWSKKTIYYFILLTFGSTFCKLDSLTKLDCTVKHAMSTAF